MTPLKKKKIAGNTATKTGKAISKAAKKPTLR
jgi:hypothetical protein